MFASVRAFEIADPTDFIQWFASGAILVAAFCDLATFALLIKLIIT